MGDKSLPNAQCQVRHRRRVGGAHQASDSRDEGDPASGPPSDPVGARNLTLANLRHGNGSPARKPFTAIGLTSQRWKPWRHRSSASTAGPGAMRRKVAIRSLHTALAWPRLGLVCGTIGQAGGRDDLRGFIDRDVPTVTLITVARRCHVPALGIRQAVLGMVEWPAEPARKRFAAPPCAPVLPRASVPPIPLPLDGLPAALWPPHTSQAARPGAASRLAVHQGAQARRCRHTSDKPNRLSTFLPRRLLALLEHLEGRVASHVLMCGNKRSDQLVTFRLVTVDLSKRAAQNAAQFS
jgi:hypothetical protein